MDINKYLLDGQEPSDETAGETPVENVASEEAGNKEDSAEADSNA